MEHYKTPKLLDNSSVSKFVKIECIDVNDLSVGQYSVNKNISFKTPMLRSDFCDYGNAYIVEKGAIGLLAAAVNEIDKAQKDFFV